MTPTPADQLGSQVRLKVRRALAKFLDRRMHSPRGVLDSSRRLAGSRRRKMYVKSMTPRLLIILVVILLLITAAMIGILLRVGSSDSGAMDSAQPFDFKRVQTGLERGREGVSLLYTCEALLS